MSSSSVRAAFAVVSGAVCVASAVALAASPAPLEPFRWWVAGAFPVSLVVFLFAYASRRAPARRPTPEERAAERMAEVRVALLTQKLQELQSAHDALSTELARVRSTPPAPTAAPVDPTPELRAEIARQRDELDAARAASARSDEAAKELRTALAAAERDAVAVRKRAEALQESSALAKVEAERLRADLDAVRAENPSGQVAKLARENDELRSRLGTLESAAAQASRRAESAAASEERLRAECRTLLADLEKSREAGERAASLTREQAELRGALEAARDANAAANDRLAAAEATNAALAAETETLRADLSRARAGEVRAESLAREQAELRGAFETARAEGAASIDRLATAEATNAALAAEVVGLRAEVDQARARDQTSRVASLSEENDALRARAAASDADLVAARGRIDAIESANARLTGETERLRADLDAARARDQTARLESLVAESEALRARVNGLEGEIVSARGRAEAAEASLAELEAAQRDLKKRMASEIANSRARSTRINLLEPYRAAPAANGAEVERLRLRVAETEEAVRAALRELGVRDADTWPTTVEGVTQAVGPLTLCAMGENAPGWNPNPDDDTLAAAVVALAFQSAERQRQLERIGASITQNGRHH